MRTIAHLSDLHFGRIDPATLQPLIDALQNIRPDLVAVSGDLTQRARIAQFKDAKAFLNCLPSPQIVVPGNHDLPLDIFFAGHLHVAHVGNTNRHEIAGHSALVIQAGTATSTRGRGELNSFNVIRIQETEVSVEPYSWQVALQIFAPSTIKYFRRSAS